MKRLKLAALPLAVFFAFTGVSEANANTHDVNEGESLWSIGIDYGVATEDIKAENGKSEDAINPGEQLEIPESSVSPEEEELLARIIHAEAKGESFDGKVGVGTVVLNRVTADQFPDSVHGVVYDIEGGSYQFSPVLDGTIDQPADEESKQAAREAIVFDGQGQGSTYFYNPAKASNHWNATRENTITIGDHVFAR
ncbi:cell wall hydrolase [Salicibibacter kimchii]|uniref:LysM peptidoglycan-binding domain-containing protein n=1 Tax=Salicibibacter kimchii TaxID=2099786 RepID=A0A345C2A3_9BACI|nr:cell wall hydrolase [Salicibibacter kimchii]AXF57334.1 LysM peptidoglycan-binding domain-containing protein [Salicibibacter kimchii]